MQMSVQTITPHRLHALREQGLDLPLIDVRTPSEYRAAHASGARLIPVDELDARSLAERSGRSDLGRDTTVYLTCHSGVRAREAAERLLAAGLKNIAVLEGGTEAWQRAGLPVEGCGSAMSLERQVQIALGALILVKLGLGYGVHPLFFALAIPIGAGLIFAGLTRWCGLARLLAAMPWNRRGAGCPEVAQA
jgi:rhodanese-related sulfurtransferase